MNDTVIEYAKKGAADFYLETVPQNLSCKLNVCFVN